MRHLFTVILITCSAACMNVLAAEGVTYDSKAIASLAERIPALAEIPVSDEIFYPGDYKGYPLVARIEDGAVVHAGIDIFGFRTGDVKDDMLLDFVERYMLELTALDSDELRQERLLTDKVDAAQMFSIPLHRDGNISLKIDRTPDKRISVHWENENGLWTMVFPADYQLIRGKNIIELEEEFILLAKEDHPCRNEIPKASQLKRVGKNVYALSNGNYLIDNLQNNHYYMKYKDRYSLISFNNTPSDTLGSLLLEAFYNTILIPYVECETNAYVNMMKYGFRVETFECTIARLVGNSIYYGCKPYLGIESYDAQTGAVVASLFLHNEFFEYDHVIKIIANLKALARGEQYMVWNANVFIPMQNIVTLFKEKQINFK